MEREFGNRTLGYLLGTVGGIAGLIYTVLAPEEKDMTYFFMGALAGRMVGEGLEYIIYRENDR